MYLKEMTVLFDFSFINTGNLSSPPDDEHFGAQAMCGVAPAFSGCAPKGEHFLTLWKGVGTDQPPRVSSPVWLWERRLRPLGSRLFVDK